MDDKVHCLVSNSIQRWEVGRKPNHLGFRSRSHSIRPNAKIYGSWKEPGIEALYIDESIEFFIATETEEQVKRVEAIVKKYMKKLGQLSYYREIDRNLDIAIIQIK